MRTIEVATDPDGHGAPITHVVIRPDGRRMATCSYDGTVVVWDCEDPVVPRPLARIRHRRLVNSAVWHPDDPEVLATASADKTAAVWRVSDAGGGSLTTVLARHTDDVNSLAWTPDGHRIVSVSEDGRAWLWDVGEGQFVAEVGAHSAHCMMVSVSTTGLVATVGEDGQVIVTDLVAGVPPVAVTYRSSIEGCAWSHAGDILAIGRDDGRVILLSAGLIELLTIGVSTSAARSVAWSPDDRRLVVGSYDGSVCCYERSGRLVWRVVDERQWPRSVAVSADVVAVGSFGNRPHLLDPADGSSLSGPTTSHHGPNAMAAEGDHLYVGCDSGAVIGYDLGTGASRIWPIAEGPILSLAASGDLLYAGTYSGRVLRVADGVVVADRHLGSPVPSLCVAGERCIAGTYGGSMVALDLRTLAVLHRSDPHSGSVKSLAATTDDIVSGSTDRQVVAGSVDDRRLLWGHGNLVNSVAALGDVVASASRDHTVKVGRTSGGDVHTLLGPDESVKCVGLLGTPARPAVVAGSYDFAAYAWDVDWEYGGTAGAALVRGRVLAEFRQAVSCLCAVNDSLMAIASWDRTIALVTQDNDGTLSVRQILRLDDLGRPRRGEVVS